MRRGLAVFLIINALVIAFLVRSVFTLLTLLVEDGSADSIHSAEIPAPNSPLIENMPQFIPKIIHQTYVDETIPEHWREAQRSCIDLHEDYEYKVGGNVPPPLPPDGSHQEGARASVRAHGADRWGQLWTDAMSRELIATEYPWFLNTFDNYTQPIQRADAIRYFVLAHFGGIYIDLDDVSALPPPLPSPPPMLPAHAAIRVATDGWIPSSPTRPGCAAPRPPASPTTPWGPSPPIPSSSSSSNP